MLDDGRATTVHCPNPGSMLGLTAPGLVVWLEPTDGPRRKFGHAWRLVELEGRGMVGIDASLANRVVAEALAEGRVPGLAGYGAVRPEVRCGHSRLDFLLSGDGLPDAYVEVKNVHLSRKEGLAEFPDSVTARGTRHLGELAAVAAAGARAVMLYLVQRSDCRRFRLASDIDRAYAAAFARARAAGVEAIAHVCRIGREGVWLAEAVPVDG